jgi:hypothetical protein
MTQAEWLNSTEPMAMLAFLRGQPVERLEPFFDRFARFVEFPERRAPERTIRLFVVACCRRIAQLVSPARVERAVHTFESLGGRLLEPLPADGCSKAIDAAEKYALGEVDVLDVELKVALTTQSLIEFYDSVYDEGMGAYDIDLAATGAAAQAVMDTCSGDKFLDQVPGHCARAVGWLAASRGESDTSAVTAESTEQCRVLREFVGNPFTQG